MRRRVERIVALLLFAGACTGNGVGSDMDPIFPDGNTGANLPDGRVGEIDGPLAAPDGGVLDPPADAPEGLPPDAPEGLPADAPEGLPPDAPEGLPPDAPTGLPPDAPPPGNICLGGIYQHEGHIDEGMLPPSCTDGDPENWVPKAGYNGGLIGHGQCGSHTSACPTDYVAGNVGDACADASTCTGFDPVCQTGAEQAGGTCSSRGCELGSNFGCPAGDTCIDAGNETYCVEGCGIREDGCFVHCARPGFSCFATESRNLGHCLFTEAVRQCNPLQGIDCTGSFGEGVCDRTGWDDPTVGKCFEACNPIAQDCSKDTEGCYAVRDVEKPVCYDNWGFAEGASCTRLTHCGEGMTCQCDYNDGSRCQPNNINMHCRRYCVPGCEGQCSAGSSCRKIPDWPYGACIPVGIPQSNLHLRRDSPLQEAKRFRAARRL